MNFIDKTKPGRLYSLLANLYFRIGALIMAVTVIIFGAIISPLMNLERTNVQHWMVVRGFTKGSRFTTYDTNETSIIIVLALILGLFVGLIALAVRRKPIIDFEQDGHLLHYGSPWRKKVFFASFLLGFTGLDRFMMQRYWLGFMKLMLFVIGMGMFIVDGEWSVTTELLVKSITLISIFLWWTIDIILIHSGTAQYKTDGCRYPIGSGKRKFAFVVSLLLGYTGIDRLMMTRRGYALIKFILFVLSTATIGAIVEYINGAQVDIIMVFALIPFIFASVYWWITDAWIIHTSSAEGTNKEYLR